MARIYSIETNEQVSKQVLLKGWVHARRDMGQIIFIDFRDKSGLVQVVFSPKELSAEFFKLAESLRPEWVIEIHGEVKERGEKTINPNLATGKVEVLAKSLEIINEAKTPPFEVDKDTIGVNEETRLQYRYLDLRSERMQRNIELRHKVIHYIRHNLTDQGFTEVQTPILTKSTPEGARDYLVPSRKHLGKFFALPQSPQQYKQLLMVAGIEKYFQIAPCFRDEDARADRSPGEFYQLDLEMSFVTQNDILKLIESLFTQLVKELLPDKNITQEPWPRLDYHEVMEKYGTDKPDLRKDKDDPNELAFAWVLDFPLFVEQSEDDYFHGVGDKYAPSHHMFTAPREEDVKLLDSDPLQVRSYQHDLVLNGFEVGGGSIRIHDPKLQDKIFDLIGFSKAEKSRFKHLQTAFEYGVPPHGGIAPGLDRLVALLAGEKNIREAIAFPLMGDAKDPLMEAPSEVDKKQLDELGLEIKSK